MGCCAFVLVFLAWTLWVFFGNGDIAGLVFVIALVLAVTQKEEGD